MNTAVASRVCAAAVLTLMLGAHAGTAHAADAPADPPPAAGRRNGTPPPANGQEPGSAQVPAGVPATEGGGSPEGRFRQAGTVYEAGRYEEAAVLYERLSKEGVDDARLHYNLGNAYFKLGRLGPAILCYERALERSPSDPDVKENLSYAALLTTDKVGSLEEDFPATMLARFAQHFGLERALVCLAILCLIGGALALPLWFSPSRSVRSALRVLLGTTVGAVIVVGLVAAIEAVHPGGGAYAVVLAPSVDGRSAPASDGTVLFTVHEGLKVEVRGERSGWVQIGLPNGLAGWIDTTALERI